MESNIDNSQAEIIKSIIKDSITNFIEITNIEDLLTEDDLRCHLFCWLKNSLKDVTQATIHSEVRWYGEHKIGMEKLKLRADLVIIDIKSLINKIGEISSMRLNSKGYAFEDYYAIIELKLRRPNDSNSDTKFGKMIKSDIEKVKLIKSITSNKHTPIAIVISFDKRRSKKEAWLIEDPNKSVKLI